MLVDIREMYKDKSTGALKPGSKGISLTEEQVGLFFFFSNQRLFNVCVADDV